MTEQEQPQNLTVIGVEDLSQVGNPIEITMDWWRTITQPDWEYQLFTGKVAKYAYAAEFASLKKRSINTASIKVSDYLDNEATIVFLAEDTYQILDAQKKSFIALEKSDIRKLIIDRRMTGHALQGQLNATITPQVGQDLASLNVYCGNILVITTFKTTVTDIPTLYAVFPARRVKTLIFGQQQPGKITRLKKSA